METDFYRVAIAYPRDLEEVVEAILSGSGMTGSEVIDLQTIAGYEAHRPESEVSDHEELLQGLQRRMPDTEIPDDSEIVQLVFFSVSEEGRQALDRMERRFYEQYGGEIRVLSEEHVDNSHWEEEWKKSYHPICVGQTLEIVPAWMEAEHPDRLRLRIDPGMAFGTGTHETTTLCLEALERRNPVGQRGLDMGTGSGILAIYMKKAGMKEVLATDIEEDALRAAENNAHLNGVSINVRESDLFDQVEGTFDIICANLLAEIVVRMLPQAKEHLKDAGVLILSGILKTKERLVRSALREEGFSVLRVTYAGDWLVMEAERSEDAHL